jgi:putative sugar O-methyltransferase
MLGDMETADPLYKPTDFWQTGLADIVKDLRSRGLDDFRSHPSAHRFYVPRYRSQSKAVQAVAAAAKAAGKQLVADRVLGLDRARWEHAIVQGLDPGGEPNLRDVSESTWGKPSEQLVFDGRRYSKSMLNYLRGLVAVKRQVPDLKIGTVLEIGGGYGTLGEILAPQGVTYIDVDIPPLAFVAARYLQEVLGVDAVADYAESRDWDSIDLNSLREQNRSAVICAWQLPKVVGTVDLFVNYISFQEMEPDVVANYAEQVKRLGAKVVLLRNSTVGKPVGTAEAGVGVREPITRDTYLELFSGYDLAFADAQLFGNDDDGRQTSQVMVLVRR